MKFDSDFRLIKKLKKTRFKFRKNYGYSPIVRLWVKRLKPGKHFPVFELRKGDISSDHFVFSHEPYSKKDFIFEYSVFEEEAISSYSDGDCMTIVGRI